MVPSLHLPHGSIPLVGYGCWKLSKDACAELVEKVIEIGYRHLDGACNYDNEVEVGKGIRCAISAGICKREDLFITSKLWNTFHSGEHVQEAAQKSLEEHFHSAQHVQEAAQKSLEDLGLEYLDLYLIHFPISLKYVSPTTRYPPRWIHDPSSPHPKMELASVPVSETWSAMEKLVDLGLVKNIGLSNWNCQGLRDIFSYANIKPAVLQIEVHPYLSQQRLVSYAQSLGMVVTAFSPLGHGASYGHENVAAIKESVITDIANVLGVTPAQVVLRWSVQRGCSVIPKSVNETRIKENMDIFKFELSAEDMERINKLERNLRFNDPGHFCPLSFNTECPIWD